MAIAEARVLAVNKTPSKRVVSALSDRSDILRLPQFSLGYAQNLVLKFI